MPRDPGRLRAAPAHSTCPGCGLDHSRSARLARLRRALPATVEQLMDRYPCMYRDPDTGQATRLLYRDLESVGAVGDEPCGVADETEWRCAA